MEEEEGARAPERSSLKIAKRGMKGLNFENTVAENEI